MSTIADGVRGGGLDTEGCVDGVDGAHTCPINGDRKAAITSTSHIVVQADRVAYEVSRHGGPTGVGLPVPAANRTSCHVIEPTVGHGHLAGHVVVVGTKLGAGRWGHNPTATNPIRLVPKHLSQDVGPPSTNKTTGTLIARTRPFGDTIPYDPNDHRGRGWVGDSTKVRRTPIVRELSCGQLITRDQ